MERASHPVAQRALRHDRQHAGAGGGLQHDIARPDRGGLERGVGERQRGRELLQANLLLGAPGVGGFQRGDRLQHRQHAARPVRPGAASAAHAPAVALEEQHRRRFDGFVGVLPDPAALGVGRAEGFRHGVPERRGVERPAGLQHRQQGLGRGVQGVARGRAGRRFGRVGGERGKGRTREGVRRRAGVEHGRLRAGRAGRRAGGAERDLPPRPAGPAPAGWPDSRRRRARRRSRSSGRPDWQTQDREGEIGRVRRRSGPGADRRRRQPNRLPSAVKVHSFMPTISSTASSEVWCSYSERSWR